MKVALVGYGYWGRNVLATLVQPASREYIVPYPFLAHTNPLQKNLIESKTQGAHKIHFEIEGVYDIDISQQNNAKVAYETLISQNDQALKHRTLKTYASFEALLADENIEALFIITPPHTHFELAKAALEARKHIFVEKPLATSLKECESLYELAQRYNCILHCDHIFLYSPAVSWLKQNLAQFGEILYVQARRINLGLFQSNVDVIWDLALHDLSILDYLFTLDIRSHHTLRQQYQGFSALADIHLQLEHFGANISVSWLSPIKVREMMIGGAKCTAIYDETKKDKIALFDCGIMASDSLAKDCLYQKMVQYHLGAVTYPTLGSVLPLQSSIADFGLQILHNTMRNELIAHTLRVVRTLEMISDK